MRRRDFIALFGSASLAWPSAARAQQPAVPVIGYLALAEVENLKAAFQRGMGELATWRARTSRSSTAFEANRRACAGPTASPHFPVRRFSKSRRLLAYGPNIGDMFRRCGVYVGKILQGAKPRDLPIQRPEKFDLVINLKTAEALRPLGTGALHRKCTIHSVDHATKLGDDAIPDQFHNAATMGRRQPGAE